MLHGLSQVYEWVTYCLAVQYLCRFFNDTPRRCRLLALCRAACKSAGQAENGRPFLTRTEISFAEHVVGLWLPLVFGSLVFGTSWNQCQSGMLLPLVIASSV